MCRTGPQLHHHICTGMRRAGGLGETLGFQSRKTASLQLGEMFLSEFKSGVLPSPSFFCSTGLEFSILLGILYSQKSSYRVHYS